ncbi:phage tail tape measure protein [Agrobacterium vitis]|uniref:Phage tail tape measure protein n=1 Tax=Agrobacterium vitis TaxID=373 RepID=A0ABD6GDR4_AGRVI|nr:phage tail tape measure protein [Agrobacterium vitis]MUO77616.1 phage tail tape measure protein [Agrobacterium vitis]MUO93133.1 phage tail tape measure protein [Agrobacterium vitis]MUP04484.1 phage tail tape measure protein [Agrobacterium vitis]NSY12443.1 phage tail tape measure protein [Agrobacterium vitis]NTA21583.1 phage tail tape measure protein [Agrobacterium vitis]
MSKLQASLVVDLVDKTGAKTSAVIGNMSRLQKAERDYMLSSKGLRLSNKDRSMERLMMERQASEEARLAQMKQDHERTVASRAAVIGRLASGAAIAGVAAGKAYVDFAELERRVGRIVINAEKGSDAIQPTIGKLQDLASKTKMPFNDIVEGFEALIVAGQSMDDAMAFLPSVAITAQATGSAVSDTANSADALSNLLKINAKDMQRAFDMMVTGGKLGKFEVKDMAREFPGLLSSYSTLGYTGTEGLKKMVAMLQTVRKQTGSSSEAATDLKGLFDKIYSQETNNKFKKFGIDLPKALAKARKEGKDVIDVLMDLTTIATKGDLSKLPLLFESDQAKTAIRALIMMRKETEQNVRLLDNVDGSTLKDFNQIISDSQAKLQDLNNEWDRLVKNVGSGVATGANPILGYINQQMDANRKASEAESERIKAVQSEATGYKGAWNARNPNAWPWEAGNAYFEATKRVKSGEQKDVMAEFTDGPPRQWPKAQGSAPSALSENELLQQQMDAALMGTNGAPNIGTVISDQITQGGGAAGKAAADTMQSQAGAIGAAIGSAIVSKISGALGSFMANPGGGMPRSTGQALQQQTNGQFVDQP